MRAVEVPMGEGKQIKIGLVAAHVLPSRLMAARHALARKLGVQVLVVGGGRELAYEESMGNVFISPGSLTGQATIGDRKGYPSFALLDLPFVRRQPSPEKKPSVHMTTYLYRLVDDAVGHVIIRFFCC